MALPCSIQTSWAHLSLASASTALSLLLAASVDPSPRSWRRSRSSLAWLWTAVKDSFRRRWATWLAIWAASDWKRGWWPGWVAARLTFATVSRWTMLCTSSLHSPQAPNTHPLILPKLFSLVSTGPTWQGGWRVPLWAGAGRGVPQYIQSTFLAVAQKSAVSPVALL